MPSATALARLRAPLVLPPPTAGNDPAALAAWLAQLPPGPRATLEARLASIAAGMPAVWQLAVARSAAATGRPPAFPLPQADLGDFSFASLALSLASAGASVGTALFASKEQKDLASETNASTNASNSALAAASAQAKTAVAAALAAATKQAAGRPAVAAGAASTPSTASPLQTLLLIGLGGTVGLLLLRAALKRPASST